MQANRKELSQSPGDAIHCHLTYFERSKGQIKVNIKPVQDFDVENIPVKLHDACNSWRIIAFKRQLDLQLVWKFKNTKVNINLIWDFDVEDIPIMLQHHTGNLWKVIVFTRCYYKLPASPTRPSTSLKIQKVTQRSTSTSSKILM